jgi:hypothetical protein
MNQIDGSNASRPWVDNLFRPLTLATMAGCVAWSISQLMLRFAPDWNPTYLVVGCVLVALEAFYSYRILRTRRTFGTSVLTYRVTELLVILILFKLGRYVSLSPSQALAEIQRWPQDLSQLFDLETLAAFALALVCWALVTETAKDFDAIGSQPERDRVPVSPTDRIAKRLFLGGIVLLVVTGFAHLEDISDLLDIRRSPVPGLIINALVYFALALATLGQLHYARLHAAWQRQQVQVSADLDRHWVRYSLASIGLAALLAFLLPTGFFFNPLQMAADALAALGGVAYFIFVLLVALISVPLGLFVWLLSFLFSDDHDPRPEIRLPALDSPPALGQADAASWLELARTLVFWAVLLTGLFFVVRSYVRDRPELRAALISLRPMRTLRRGWMALTLWLRRWFFRLRQTVTEKMPRRIPGRLADYVDITRPFRFFRLGALSPQERILYYYLSIVRRAGNQGFPRQAHQTPNEYSRELKPHLPQAQAEIEDLTHAFLEARYSQHLIELDRDLSVRASWERVKAALRALKSQARHQE